MILKINDIEFNVSSEKWNEILEYSQDNYIVGRDWEYWEEGEVIELSLRNEDSNHILLKAIDPKGQYITISEMVIYDNSLEDFSKGFEVELINSDCPNFIKPFLNSQFPFYLITDGNGQFLTSNSNRYLDILRCEMEEMSMQTTSEPVLYDLAAFEAEHFFKTAT